MQMGGLCQTLNLILRLGKEGQDRHYGSLYNIDFLALFFFGQNPLGFYCVVFSAPAFFCLRLSFFLRCSFRRPSCWRHEIEEEWKKGKPRTTTEVRFCYIERGEDGGSVFIEKKWLNLNLNWDVYCSIINYFPCVIITPLPSLYIQ